MKVLVAGDFVPFGRTYDLIEKENYSCLDEVKPIVQAVDYAILNLEAPVVKRTAQPIEKTGPHLKCSENALDCIAQAGFHCVTLANNHFRDYGQIGVEDTIDLCDKYKIDYVGGGKTQEEAGHILYKEIEEETIAIINCCEHEWSITNAYHGGSNPIDIISIFHDIQEARGRAKYVIVIVHGGIEHYNLPTPEMKRMYHFFIDNGADVIVNHHQHCYSGYERYNNKLIFYGLGNFCFDKDKGLGAKLWEEGYMVELLLDDQISFTLYPYIQCDKDRPKVSLIKDSDNFFTSINDLNHTISDDNLLTTKYKDYALKAGEIMIRNILAPYSSSIMMKLLNRKMIPSFSTRRRKKRVLAYVQCESHRQVLISILKKQLI